MFDVGDKVVYPHHGAAVVEKREVREAFGEKREYLVLRLAYGDLTLMVPADNTDEVGLREVINDEEVEEVFAVLRKKEARMPTNWSRRYKNHVEKLKSGDIYQVAEVVRNLSIRDKDKGLSAGEKRMLTRAAPDPRLRAHLRHRRQRGRSRGAAERRSPLSVPRTLPARSGRSSSLPAKVAFGRQRQFARLAGRLVVEWSMDAAARSVDGLVLVVPPDRSRTPRCTPGRTVVTPAERRAPKASADGLAVGARRRRDILVHDAGPATCLTGAFRGYGRCDSAGARRCRPGGPVSPTRSSGVARRGRETWTGRARHGADPAGLPRRRRSAAPKVWSDRRRRAGRARVIAVRGRAGGAARTDSSPTRRSRHLRAPRRAEVIGTMSPSGRPRLRRPPLLAGTRGRPN